jgi:NAD(P)-dependent dehydrogenase (short-subunit alcohol dehydrogenase family)
VIRFDGQVAIVTGAGNGLGRSYAQLLAARGARLVVNNRRRPTDAAGATSAERTVAEIRAAGGEAVPNFDDVRSPTSGTTLVTQALDAFGRLDIVVNNAGVGQHSAFHKLSVEQFRDVFDVNFYGTLYLTHAAYLHMHAQSYGRIIVSSSSAGLHGLHGLTAYSASKSALIGLMRALAQEGARRNVLCNAICPYASTQMTAAQATPEFTANMPPELVAPMVAYLASDQQRVNGKALLAGKGAFRRAFMVEGEGHGYAHADEVTPESIARDVESILAGDGSREFPNALQSFEQFFQSYPGVSSPSGVI